MTKDLVDGHFKLELEDDEEMPIIPSIARYYKKYGADWYDTNTYKNEAFQKSEVSETSLISIGLKSYVNKEYISHNALVGEEYRTTRIEYGDDWYLVGQYKEGEIPVGQRVRIEN